MVFKAPDGWPSYQWYFNDTILDSPAFEGETSQYLTWNVPVSREWYGAFTCVSDRRESVGITVKQGTLGIQEPDPDISGKPGLWSVKVFPNPTSGKFQVSGTASLTNSKKQIQNIEILDSNGKVIDGNVLNLKSGACLDFGTGNLEFNISPLPAGVYFLRIVTEDQMIVKKIIKL